MFAHLRVSSHYSMRHGTAAPARLVEEASRLGQPFAALTDRDGVYGTAEHLDACRRSGVRPVLGVDLALASPDRGRVVLLARGAAGWASLCRLVTAAHHRPSGPVAVTREEVAGRPDGLVVLLGPDSDVGRSLAQRRGPHARALLAAWRRTGAEIVLAPHDHGVDGQLHVARSLVRMADDERLLAVLTNTVRHPAADDAPVARALDRIRGYAPGGYSPGPATDRAFLAGSEHMGEVALGVCGGDSTRARRLVAHTLALALSCVMDPVADLGAGRIHLPDRPGAPAELRARLESGAARLGLDRSRPARERVEEELVTVARLGLESYLLTIADAADAIRAEGIRCSARGSAVGSMIVHQLGVSAVDPLEHGLLFERFCGPDRPMPDIDLDVESARRLEAYDAVIAAHSGESAAVAMIDTYRARSALRDAGLALSMPSAEVERIVALFPRVKASRISETIEDLPELRTMAGWDGPRVRELVELAQRFSDLPRHVAMHPCGLVLSDHALTDRVPTRPAGSGHAMVMADKHAVESWQLGLLKLDVLGVRMQSALAHALGEVERTTGERVDLDRVPDGDPATAHMMAHSRTVGCFQTESPGQRELVSRLRPATVADLTVDISLFRPGPIGSDIVGAYLAARAGGGAVPAAHPSLEPILAETGGVMVWHEQMLRVLAAMTGSGLHQAEAMRRALARPQGVREVAAEFRVRAAEHGHPRAVVDAVWAQVAAFAAFGFTKAHGVAFAQVSYRSAWMKRHHPAAFTAGLLTHAPGMYPRRTLLQEMRRFGVRVLPLDVHASDRVWRVERVGDLDRGVRPPLSDVGSLTGAEADRLIARRPFADLRDLVVRARPSAPALDDLVLVGALDALTGADREGGPDRRDVLLHAHALLRAHPPRAAGEGQLALRTGPDRVRAGRAAPMTHPERLAEEGRVLGYEISGHVMDRHADRLAELEARQSPRLVAAADLHREPTGATVAVAGLKVAVQTPPMRSGRRVIFASVEDRTGLVEAAMFADAQEHGAAVLRSEPFVVVTGRVRRSAPGALPTLTIATVRPLAE